MVEPTATAEPITSTNNPRPVETAISTTIAENNNLKPGQIGRHWIGPTDAIVEIIIVSDFQ